MSEQAPVKKRGAGKDPEFMKKMRERAAVVRQQNASIRAAEKLKQTKEREKKLKDAQDYLNPPPVQEMTNEPDEPDEPDEQEETTPAPRKRAPKATTEEQPNYKQEYYRQKLELLKLKQDAPAAKEAPPQQPQAHPYELARHDIHQHVNKAVMDNMWRQYFPDHASPYS